VISTGSKVQGSFAFIVSQGKGRFYITIITCQGYALAGPRPPGTRSTTVISLQHNPPGIRPVQPKYPFRPNEQFFEVMKKQKMSTLSAPAQQAKSFLTEAEIGSYEEDGEVYDREKLGLRPDDPVFMKHEVPKKFEFEKPFLMSVELFK
jgi:hypothetical protein